jgi:hypothetical protein
MSSTVWAVPAARARETYILRFPKDVGCSVRVGEVKLLKTAAYSTQCQRTSGAGNPRAI